MLVPVQTSGTRPPLFLVHGQHGVMPLGTSFARQLGADQPFFAVNADGMDGKRPVINKMQAMATAYAQQIDETRPAGHLRIGGMCSGGMAAIEVARELQKRGRQIGPVVLADPPPTPFGYQKKHTAPATNPLVASQLYRQTRYSLLDHAKHFSNELPFDPSDSQQVHLATLAGVGSLVAFAEHVPTSFFGAVQIILSPRRAAAFFHPQMPLRKLLLGPVTVHVLPWDHMDLFRTGLRPVARLLKFMLEREADCIENIALRDAQRTVA